MTYKKNIQDLFPGIMYLISSEDASVVLIYTYLAHHFCLTEKKSISVSYDEITNGGILDSGTGCASKTISAALKRLGKLGLVKLKQRKFKNLQGQPRFQNFYKVRCLDSLGKERKEFSLSNTESVTSSNIEKACGLKSQAGQWAEGSISLQDEGEFPALHSSIVSVVTTPIKPLLQHLDKTTQSTSPDKARLAALQLKEALARKNKLMRVVKVGVWANQLRPYLEKEPARFKRVLDWYCDHIGEEKVPWAFSATGFIEKFPNIEQSMLIKTTQHFEEEDYVPPKREAPIPEEQKEEIEQQKLASLFGKL